MPVTIVPKPLTGKILRWVVCLMLHDERKQMSVSEIAAELEAAGYEVPGARKGKLISDALRWEVQRGRVILVRRGVYARGFMQRSTMYSMRERVSKIGVLPTSLRRRSSLVAESAAITDSDDEFVGAADWDGPSVPFNADLYATAEDDRD